MKSNPPTIDDVKSHHELGVVFRRPLDAEAMRLSRGLSVSDDAEKLRRMARVNPELGTFIAVLAIEDDGPVRSEKTTKRRDHYTLWGNPSQILDCVERVESL